MGRLRTDSPVSRRIVLAFLDFLKSVDSAPGTDLEGLDVARDCLEEVFGIDESSTDCRVQPGLLIDLFRSADMPNQLNSVPVNAPAIATASDTTSTTPSRNDANYCMQGASESVEQQGDHEGESKDELFGQFYAALDRINFFATTPGGVEDNGQVVKATQIFEEALLEMEESESQRLNQTDLAETFKSQGNRSMQSKLYSKAIELYTCAIALSERNAIYYCNRAAAYTQMCRYNEAIADCKKSIEIDPNYAKAYSRQGLVYYGLGKYKEAVLIFLKALELDPNNESVKENIKVAQQKWREQQQTEGGHQSAGSSHGQQNTRSAGARVNATGFQMPVNLANFAQYIVNAPPASGSSHDSNTNSQTPGSTSHDGPSTSMPNDASISIDLSQILSGMMSGVGQQSHARANDNTAGVNSTNEPGIRLDSEINFEDLPQQLSDVIGSVVHMFAPPSREQGDGSSNN